MKSRHEQIDLARLNLISIHDRKSIVTVEDFGHPEKIDTKALKSLFNALPNILAAENLKNLAKKLVDLKNHGKPIILTLGAHNVKVGVSPFIIDLMKKGFISAIGVNGAFVIHDTEIALFGRTSEDVKAHISLGKFAVTKETSDFLNLAMDKYIPEGLGLGESYGKALNETETPYGDVSIVKQAYIHEIPLTVHVAIGTDFIHMHPSMNGALLGEGTLRDFKIFTHQISKLSDGGAIVNIGSAVVLPVVIEKAIAVCQNIGFDLKNFLGVNFDFMKHYRTSLNPLTRAKEVGGEAIEIIGHHEINIPLLWGMLMGLLDTSE
ncbi:hypothetical protein KKB99_04455 [bacterium]|nr:hypothetical protein [bacterium]MBU1025246.1 hypothetical protein [bacterium]